MAYTIDDFWRPQFSGSVPLAGRSDLLQGWQTGSAPNPTFVEADLNLREGFSNLDQPVWFVAAPGAVGKSTLAKEISARTGVAYLDLAQADTVAGNYLTGGLVKNGLLSEWQNGTTTVLVDALDEARLRVTKSSFEDFLGDIAALSVPGRKLPTVIFGRVGIVEEAWLSMADRGILCPIFDIDYFDRPRAERFILTAMMRTAQRPEHAALAASLQAHLEVYRGAITRLVSALENAASSDGARFAGYAPVLEAVATVLSGTTNPSTVDEAIQEAMQGQVLQHLTNEILLREARKLRAQLPESIPSAAKELLYLPAEQLSRLSAVIYHVELPELPNELDQQQVGIYEAAVQGFISQHPYLDGTGRKPSGAVFAAAINAHALRSGIPDLVRAGEKQAGQGPHTPNPFLVDFYLTSLSAETRTAIPPEHLISIYDSIKARAAANELVRLVVEADSEDEDADAEILVLANSSTLKRIEVLTSQAGVLRFGRQVSGVSVDAPQMDVVVGSGNPVELVAPIFLNVASISFDCPEVVIQQGDKSAEDSAVVIEAAMFKEGRLVSPPVVRKGAELSVSWPGVHSYPWSQFAARASSGDGSADHDSLRRLRRLVLAFRSHSKGQLARFKDKIEHARMTQGELGDSIRKRLLQDGVLTADGKMYYLDSTKLGEIVGVQFQDLKMNRFSDRVHSYLSSIGKTGT